MGKHGLSIAERFWAQVDKGPDGDGHGSHGCWLWRGGLRRGYGVLTVNRRHVYAHRIAMGLAAGRELSRSVLACHRCDNRSCVRWDHLYEGTKSTNALDAIERGRLVPSAVSIRDALHERAWAEAIDWHEAVIVTGAPDPYRYGRAMAAAELVGCLPQPKQGRKAA